MERSGESMITNIEAGETVLYKLKKSKTPIVFIVIFYPIWIYFGSFLLRAYLRYLFDGASDAPPVEYLLSGLIVFVVVIPILLLILLSYTLNNLVITDRHIYIRKGVTGRTHIVELNEIRSFQHAYSRGRNGSNNKIILYLYNGQLIKTGQLFITLFSLTSLLELLRGRFEGRGFNREERLELARGNPGARGAVTQTNALIVLLMLMPLLLAVTSAMLYLFNIRF